jgi:hypothetical protein
LWFTAQSFFNVVNGQMLDAMLRARRLELNKKNQLQQLTRISSYARAKSVITVVSSSMQTVRFFACHARAKNDEFVAKIAYTQKQNHQQNKKSYEIRL